MPARHLLVAAVAATAFMTPAAAASAHTATAVRLLPAPTARCTTTSSGSCIRGGEFCPRAMYGHAGYDASGRRYVCKGNHTHPHWMK